MTEPKIVTHSGKPVRFVQREDRKFAIRIGDNTFLQSFIFDRANALALRDAFSRALELGEG